MTILLTILHVLVCVLLVVAVLLQSGKGGGLAASVGGGLSSSSVLGGRAATSFLTKATTYLAAGFLVLCLALAVAYDEDEGLPTTASERLLEAQQGIAPIAPAPFNPNAAEESGEEAAALPE
jgi:preprotein translocase subunit SecG